MKRFIISSLVALAATLILVPYSHSASCVDVELPDSVTVDGTDLVLNGLGLREATVANVDVYVAGLYLESQTSSASRIISSDGARRLILHFVRSVDKDDITDAWVEGFQENVGHNWLIHQAKIRELNEWMRDMRDGQTMVFTYTPSGGLEVEVNGSSRGSIEGADFASAFFSIWLGENPPNRGLKRGLLGGECD